MYINFVITLGQLITTFNSPPQIAPKPTAKKGISANNYCILKKTYIFHLFVIIGRSMSTDIPPLIAPKPSTKKGTQ